MIEIKIKRIDLLNLLCKNYGLGKGIKNRTVFWVQNIKFHKP